MKDSLKKIFLDTTYTFYALSLVSLFSVIGAFIIYFNPEFYSTIDYKALFLWLYYNQSPYNFWIYGVLISFIFLGISGVFCSFYDIKRKNIFTFLFHLSFLLVLVGHIVNAVSSFKLPEQIIPQGVSNIISLPPPYKPIRVFLDKIDFDMTPQGYPKNIKAELIYTDGNTEKRGTLKINEPLKIGSSYLVLKYIAPYLRSITFKLRSDDNKLLIPVITPTRPFNLEGTIIEFLANNEDMTMYKVMLADGEKREVMIWKVGEKVNIKGKEYTITQIIPDTIGSIVVDVVRDSSIGIIFFASTLFMVVIVIRLLKGKG